MRPQAVYGRGSVTMETKQGQTESAVYRFFLTTKLISVKSLKPEDEGRSRERDVVIFLI